MSNLMRRKIRYLNPIISIGIDVLMIGAVLLTFALFHHVLRFESEEPVVLPTPTLVPTVFRTAAPTPDATNTPTPEPTIDADTSGTFGMKFYDKFTEEGETVLEDMRYISHDVSITVEKVSETNLTYYVADIYIRDISCFRTAFSSGDINGTKRKRITELSKEVGAILAMCGDFCNVSPSTPGIIVRNGTLYRDEVARNSDLCVMDYNGNFILLESGTYTLDDVLALSPYQTWCFGPNLVKDGELMQDFDKIGIKGLNPRSVIGIYEPGHYCFVLVDGRQGSYSRGLDLYKLAELMYNLGCTDAYNLDGGQSAAMSLYHGIVNQPYNGGRRLGDIVYIADMTREEE